MVHAEIPRVELEKLLEILSLTNDLAAEKCILDVATKHISDAKSAVILVDVGTVRYGCVEETQELIEKSGLHFFATPMGKSLIHEDHAQYGGIYIGNLTSEPFKKIVEGAEILITVGSLKSDFNFGNFSYRTPKERTVELQGEYTVIGYSHSLELEGKVGFLNSLNDGPNPNKKDGERPVRCCQVVRQR